MENDTIVAISTPAGLSGIALIRLSGPAAISIIQRLFRPARKKSFSDWPTHTVRYGFIVDGQRLIDEVLVTLMRKPRSYTREDMAEIGCHGGFTAARAVLRACLKHGARLAAPGEFTRRAYLHGRIDLTQAESVLEVVESRTEEALSLSLSKLKGELSPVFAEIKDKTLELLSRIEAAVNFPEDYPEEETTAISQGMRSLLGVCLRLKERAGQGKLFVEGVKAAIVGRTNVGKSSLLNALLREERALVTEIPGTTRDALHEVINLRGIPLTIIDTAGFRKAQGVIERMGVARAKEWMDRAEVNILVLDISRPLTFSDRELLNHVRKKKHLVVLNKCDLPRRLNLKILEKLSPCPPIHLSARKGTGLKQLEDRLYQLLVAGPATASLYLNLRQEQLLNHIITQAREALTSLENGISAEFIVDNLKLILKDVDGLTGQQLDQELLDRIFSRFCIGK